MLTNKPNAAEYGALHKYCEIFGERKITTTKKSLSIPSYGSESRTKEWFYSVQFVECASCLLSTQHNPRII